MRFTWVLGSLLVFVVPLRAQTSYGDLDAGRPLRIEDAEAIERYTLGLQLAPLRAERDAGGQYRWRAEPKVSYGVLARTEIELRAPAVYIDGTPSRLGISGLGLDALRALTIETPHVPALAVAGEVLLPVGSLASPRTTYSAKAIATRSFSIVRLHLNAGIGDWSAPATAPTCPRFTLPGLDNPCTTEPTQPFIPDLPCSVAPRADDGDFAPRRFCGSRLTTTAAASDASSRRGSRWLVGLAADHAFALHSFLVGADLYTERFVGLYTRPDWAGEVGVRRQWSPRLVLDAGLTRRFAGVNRATLGTVGLTFDIAAHALQHRG